MGLAGLCHRPFGEGCTAQNAGLCHRPFGEACPAQNAGFASVARRRRCGQTSPSSCWARLMCARQQLHGPVRALRTTECRDNHSVTGTGSRNAEGSARGSRLFWALLVLLFLLRVLGVVLLSVGR